MRLTTMFCVFDSRLLLATLLVSANGVVSATDRASVYCVDPSSESLFAAETLAVSTLNISHGRNTSINQLLVSKKKTYENLDRVAAFLDDMDADVVALQEVDAESRWSGGFDHARYLLDNSLFDCIIHGRHSRSWMASYGTALLSKHAFQASAAIDFASTSFSPTKGYVRARLDWSVDGEIVPVTIVSVHLDFLRKKARQSQIQEMIDGLSVLDTELILMGDLNSVWDEKQPYVRTLAEGLDLKVYAPEAEDLGTYKGLSGKRFDWILISSGLEFERYTVMPDVVADHLAVFAEIRYAGVRRQ